MKFKYKKIPLYDPVTSKLKDSAYRPIIPVTLKSGAKEIDYEVLVDSGADENIFDSEIAEILDLDNTNVVGEKRFVGLGGAQITGYLLEMNLVLGGHEYGISAYFADDIGPNSYGILGQKGFFDLYRIRFIYSKKVVEIRPEND